MLPTQQLAASISHRTFTPRVLSAALVIANALVASLHSEASDGIELETLSGSLVKGSSERDIGPIQIIDREFIESSGALTAGELSQKLPISSGTENYPDPFTAAQTQGTSNINLRGLGLSSTLVLINGKRQTLAAAAATDGSTFVDTSTVPMMALERVEIVKEGATATYGSDAIAGVVNFVLRENYEGFELSGSYQSTATDNQDTSDIQFLSGLNVGTNTNLLLAGRFMSQSPLGSQDRSYTTINSVSTLGRSFLLLAPDSVVDGPYAGNFEALETVPDANCEANGGLLGTPFVPKDANGAGTGGGSKCGFFYGPRFNVINDEEQVQLYSKISHKFSGGTSMGIELGWTQHEVLDNPQSPSYPDLAFPTILPGQAGSPFNVPVRWYGRPLGAEAPSPLAPRNSDTYRASIDLNGRFNENWDWYGAITYSKSAREVYQPDTIASRLDAAIAGQGGINGDETFNLFDPSVNSQALIDYISTDTYTKRETDLLVGDLVLSGDLFATTAGNVGLTTGVQWREDSYTVTRNPIFTQQIDPNTGFPLPVDLIFLGGGIPVDASKSTYAAFAELTIPLADTLDIDVAGRYEKLDNDSNVDTKVALSWQAADTLFFRASASSAFREPSLQQYFSQETRLEGLTDPLDASNTFVRVDIVGNAELTPEQSNNYNIGLTWKPNGQLTARLDYWRFDYQDMIVAESAQGKLDADPTGIDVLRTADGQLVGVRTDYVNTESVETDGVDLTIDWVIPTDIGQFEVSVLASHFFSYTIPCTNANARGCTGDSGTQDVAGYFNYDNFVRSLPETKINTTVNWSKGNHAVAVMGYYVGGYETTRPLNARAEAFNFNQEIESWLTFDVQYSYTLNMNNRDAVFTLGSKNVTDQAAPKAWDDTNLGYDPKQHDPRGQLWYGRVKIAL